MLATVTSNQRKLFPAAQAKKLTPPGQTSAIGGADPKPTTPQPDTLTTLRDAASVPAPSPVTTQPQTVTSATGSPLLSENLNRILGEGSPLMDRARARSQQSAAGRGLLNSTMAAQAGEAAVIDAALPIAQGDTQHFQNLANIDAQTSGQMSLQEQQFENNIGLLQQELSNATALSGVDHSEQLQLIQTQHQNNLAEIAASSNAALGPQYLVQAGNLMAATSAEIAQIYQTEGLSTAQQQNAVNSANARLLSNLSLLSNYYATVPGWNPNFGTDPGSPQPPGAAPAPPGAPPPGFGPQSPGNDPVGLGTTQGSLAARGTDPSGFRAPRDTQQIGPYGGDRRYLIPPRSR